MSDKQQENEKQENKPFTEEEFIEALKKASQPVETQESKDDDPEDNDD